jgi:hypothetical protein
MGDSLNPIPSGGLLDGSCINLPICFGRWTSRPLPEPPPHHALTLLREIARLVASHSVCSCDKRKVKELRLIRGGVGNET